MIHRKIRLVLYILIALMMIQPAQAQLGEAPLVILMQGDLHAWDNGQLFRLTNNGYNSMPVISPQGRYVAYGSISPLGTRVLEEGFVGDALFPSDIFIYDLQTNGISPAALQPPDTRFMTQNSSDNFITRSNPAWSPDGSSLAWTEMVVPGFGHQLVRYDVNTSATTVLASLPTSDGIPAPAPVVWVGPNIVVQNFRFDPAFSVAQNVYTTFAANGKQLNEVRLADTGDAARLDLVEVIQGTQRGPSNPAFLGLQYAGGLWEVIDPLTGVRQELIDPPEMFSLDNPNSSVTLRAVADLNPQVGLVYAWDVISSSRQITERLPFDGRPSQITIAPDGQRIAYIADDGVYVRSGQQAQRISGTQIVVDDFGASVTWGATTWRTPASIASVAVPTIAPTISASGTTTCPGFLPSRITVGQQGRVTDSNNIPNNVRSQPSAAAERVGQIPAGDVFQVIGGPICAENTAWWQVRYRTLTGWTAEGASGEYWLEPFTTPAASSQAQSYIVQRGDILARIAQEYGVTVNCLIQLNNLTDPNRLLPGQVLVIDPVSCP